MREGIGKYKAKRLDNGEWVEVWLVSDEDQLCYIIPDGTSRIYQDCGDELMAETARMVDSETICEFTGLKDKNGTDICEGDLVSIGSFSDNHVIEWQQGGIGYSYTHEDGHKEFVGMCNHLHFEWVMENIEVIGNIHDEKGEG